MLIRSLSLAALILAVAACGAAPSDEAATDGSPAAAPTANVSGDALGVAVDALGAAAGECVADQAAQCAAEKAAECADCTECTECVADEPTECGFEADCKVGEPPAQKKDIGGTPE